MAAEDHHLRAVDEQPDNRSRVWSNDPRGLQLAAALEKGKPIIVGDTLPEWTIEDSELPPAQLGITADTIRQILIDRDLALRADPSGLEIRGAVIVGTLNLNDTVIGYPLRFINCHFTHDLELEHSSLPALYIDGSQFDGVIRLYGAHIRGQIRIEGSNLNGTDTDGFSLLADRLRTDNRLLLDGSTMAGAIRIRGAHIAGQLTARGAAINGADTDGFSLLGEGLKADDLVVLDKGFITAGAIELARAHVGGSCLMVGAAVNGADAEGISLNCELLRVEGRLILYGLNAVGSIRLSSAHIRGLLALGGASLNGTKPDGCSLIADHMRADNIVFLQDVTAAGAIRLHGAHIAGHLDLRGASINGVNRDGDSLVAHGLRVDSAVFLDEVTAVGEISLPGADIGILRVDQEVGALPRLGAVTGWRIGDLVGVIRTDRRAAAGWLKTQKAAQPWQELAAVYDRNGQPADARWLRYKSAVRSTRSAKGLSWLGRQTYRCTTGHGYYPLIALGWLVVIFALAWYLTALWADEFTTATTATISADLTARASGQVEDPPIPDPLPGRVPAAWCSEGWDVPCLNPPVYALTTAFPAAAATQPWAPPDDSLAPAFVFYGWWPADFGVPHTKPAVVLYVLRLLAWVFTAILLAGVTGLLRKQT